MRLYLTLAALFICSLAAFGPADLQARYDALQVKIDACWTAECVSKANAEQKAILDELDRRDREKLQALTQAPEGKRQP